MKFSFMTFSCPELDLDSILEVAECYGYDGIELRLSSGHGHGLEFDTDAETRSAAKNKAQDAGVSICCIATSCRFSDPEIVDEAVEEAHKAIDLAGDLDAKRIRVFGGPIAEGLSRDDAVKQVVASMNSIKGHASDRDVFVCVETHDDWCDPVNLERVMKQVDHPKIRINWDIMHPVFTEGLNMDEAFEKVKPWVEHVHVHDCIRENGERVIVPIGEGMIDHDRAFELLRSIDYDGFISGEWINWLPYEDHLQSELRTMKGL